MTTGNDVRIDKMYMLSRVRAGIAHAPILSAHKINFLWQWPTCVHWEINCDYKNLWLEHKLSTGPFWFWTQPIFFLSLSQIDGTRHLKWAVYFGLFKQGISNALHSTGMRLNWTSINLIWIISGFFWAFLFLAARYNDNKLLFLSFFTRCICFFINIFTVFLCSISINQIDNPINSNLIFRFGHESYHEMNHQRDKVLKWAKYLSGVLKLAKSYSSNVRHVNF